MIVQGRRYRFEGDSIPSNFYIPNQRLDEIADHESFRVAMAVTLGALSGGLMGVLLGFILWGIACHA